MLIAPDYYDRETGQEEKEEVVVEKVTLADEHRFAQDTLKQVRIVLFITRVICHIVFFY